MTILAVTGALPGAAQTAPPFGQEPVEIRAPRVEQRLEGHSHRGHAHGHSHGGHDHGIETESLFGFVLGSDVDRRGSLSIASENVLRLSRGTGRYTALGQKLEIAYGLTDDLSVSLALLGAHHRIRDVPDFMDVNRYGFAGIGGEVRWRLVRRSEAGFGLTLHAEPRFSTADEVSGQCGRGFASENKLIIDTEFVRERVYAALNLIYGIERFRERGATETERASAVGVGVAVTAAVSENVFLGGELRRA